MIKKPVKIQLSEGLDARPIALLVQEASQYSSSVYIEVDQKQVNAKSIMGMMSLTLMPGEEITVVANGTDEKEAAAGRPWGKVEFRAAFIPQLLVIEFLESGRIGHCNLVRYGFETE